MSKANLDFKEIVRPKPRPTLLSHEMLYETLPPSNRTIIAQPIHCKSRIIHGHLRTVNMRHHKLKLPPHILILRITHPIPPMQLLFKLLSTLHRIMMYSYPIPRNRLSESMRMDDIPLFANSVGAGTEVETVRVERASRVGRFDDRFYVLVGSSFAVPHAGCE